VWEADRQTVSYLKENEAHTVVQCNQTHKEEGEESILTVSGWTQSNSPQDNKYSCQDNRNEKPKQIFVRDETKP